MSIKEITFTKGITINLGNFQSIRMDAAVKIEIDEKGYDATFLDARQIVDDQLSQEANLLGVDRATLKKFGLD